MRICMLNDEHFPFKSADTINVVRTAAALGQAGAEVDLAVPRLWGGNVGIDELCAYYGARPTFRLIRIPTVLPTTRSLRFEKLTHSLLAPWLAVLLDADVVYSRNVLALAIARVLQKPWVFETYRRFDEETPWLARLTRHLPLETALAAVVHSRASGEGLVRLGFRPDAILTAYSGYLDDEVLPRLSKQEALRLSGLDIDGPVVLHLGNIDPYIRLDWLLASAGRLPEVTFLFVGGYEAQQAHWRGWCEKHGVKNARFVPNQPPSEVRKFLYAADLLAVVPRNADYQEEVAPFIFPSLYKVLPGIPMKIFLYKASGIPIFAPDLPYLGEVLKDGENAFLAPLDSVDQVTAALKRPLDDKPLARRIAESALHDEALCTWTERGARIHGFLEQRLARPRHE